jgi:mono/diheme cytochrome c family protein
LALTRAATSTAASIAAVVLSVIAGDGVGRAMPVSIWDGVYTEAQAKRGERIYPDSCGKCHGARLDGAPDDPDMFPTPPIAGAKFLRDWKGRTLAAVYEYSRTTMPANNPGFLGDQEFADILAYMLSVSRIPAGADELRPDVEWLRNIEIRQYLRP